MVEFSTSESQPKSRGQAMVEYALILALLAVAFGFAIAATGPAIGNVFCNVVHNLGGNTASPQGGQCGSTAPDLAGEGGNPPLFWATVTWVAQHPQGETPFPTPLHRAPPSGGGPADTLTPSITPSPTDTDTVTPSPTNTDTATPGPSQTPTDAPFSLPHVDQISKAAYWRLESGNPDDIPAACSTWDRSAAAGDAVSVSWLFSANSSDGSWTTGETCYAEMRGYVNLDILTNTHPILSFWDIWDFASSANATAQLQISPYVDDGSGGVNRAALSWQTIASRAAGTSNYAWTRSQIDLSTVAGVSTTPGVSDKVTFRFVIGSTSPGTPFRWYIDDLQIVNEPTPTDTFTIRDEWDLNARPQMRDFIFDNDSNLTITDNGLPGPIEAWRWDLTSNNTHGAGTAWDDSPTGNYDGFSQEPVGSQRVHYLELKYPVNLVGAPATDLQGDNGTPLLSFWQAFDIETNASIRVEYTRDPKDITPDTWSAIPNQGVLIDYLNPSGTGRTSLTMLPVEIDLTNIPNWDTLPFRLRFALYVDGAATSYGDGWYIDDIKLERENGSPFFAYPLIDDAENSVFTADTWDAIGGRWGATTSKGGANSSATAYADSPPAAAYDPGDTQTLQLHYAIDLLHDTPTNTAGGTAAVNPVLTFWQQRNVASGVSFSVELWTATTGWDSIWAYNSASDASYRTQNAWERVEINLVTALETVSGQSWATIAGNPSLIDDDIKVRFVFATGAALPADGVYIDEIRIGNATTLAHKLWDTGSGGNGAFVDSIESSTHFGGGWQVRWYHGGVWGSTSLYTRTGSQALTDSPSGNYSANTNSVLELIPVIDLTSTTALQRPMLSFWTRYQIGSDDSFRVEIANANAGDTAQAYDKIGGWTAWAAQPMMVGVPAPGNELIGTEVATWLRGQVDLSGFVGGKIRVRFVASVPNSSNQADGMYVDEVAFTYNPRQFALPFTDNVQNVANWVPEGIWSLGQNYFYGVGTNPSDFGSTSWIGTYFDCEQLLPAADCSLTATYTQILLTNANYLPSDTPVYSGGRVGPEIIANVNFNWGSTERPLNNASEDPAYLDTFAGRWTRSVTLSPGTYSFSTVSDDGVRLWIDDYTGTNLADPTAVSGGTANSRYIINNWGLHGPALDYATFTVSGTINRTLTLEYFENTGGAEIILNATSSSYSFTDSPTSGTCSPPSGTCVNGFTVVNSLYPGNSSLMSDGFFNLSSGTPSLSYRRLYTLPASNFFYVEVSTNGGFTWSQIATETLSNATRVPPGDDWEARNVGLSSFQQPNVMIRFRLDTRGSGGTTGDGIYIADIHVTS